MNINVIPYEGVHGHIHFQFPSPLAGKVRHLPVWYSFFDSMGASKPSGSNNSQNKICSHKTEMDDKEDKKV